MKRRGSSAAKARPARTLVQISSVSLLRSALTVAGDIRSDVAFQNDVNALLATVGKLTALGPNDVPRAVAVKSKDYTPEPVVASPAPVPATRPAPVWRARASIRG